MTEKDIKQKLREAPDEGFRALFDEYWSYAYTIIEHIENILDRGEAQRDHHGIHYRVKTKIEIRVIPAASLKEEIFASFFDQRDAQKIIHKADQYRIHT